MFGSHPWLTHFVLSVWKTRSFEAEMSLEWPQDCVQLALDWPIVVRLADCHLIGNNAGWMQGDMFLAAWLPIQQDWRWSKGLAWIGWDCKETLCNVNIVNLFHNLSGMTLHLRLARHWLVGWQCRANCGRLGGVWCNGEGSVAWSKSPSIETLPCIHIEDFFYGYLRNWPPIGFRLASTVPIHKNANWCFGIEWQLVGMNFVLRADWGPSHIEYLFLGYGHKVVSDWPDIGTWFVKIGID